MLVMPKAYFITHPDVQIDPAVPVPEWPLSSRGRHRMSQILAQPWVGGLRSIWSSSERKARDGAAILADGLGLSVAELATLGENDRSATGYLPRAEFQAVAELFFAHPETSVRGWERALDAQDRIIAAVNQALAASEAGGDVAIVSHGGVGTLLLCHLKGCSIGKEHDQPANNGGNYYVFDIENRMLCHGWKPID